MDAYSTTKAPQVTCCCCGRVLRFAQHKSGPYPETRQRIYDFVRQHPEGVTNREIVWEIYGRDRNGGPLHADTTIRTHICILNRALRPTGHEIRGRSSAGSRYRLLPYAKP